MKLAFGLSAWIIQDGNYGDFEAGRRIEVAGEFHLERFEIVGPQPGACTTVDGSVHDLVGEVTYASQEVWVLDAGIQIYCEGSPPEGVAAGVTLRGMAYVEVDHFAYFERFAHDPDVPPLIYAWRVAKILRQTAPFIQEGRMRRRDPERLAWVEVTRTAAWTDDGGYGEYVLECELLADAPKRSSATAC